jgi:hypothetical protein
MSEEAYARSVLAGKLGTDRMKERATALGKLVSEIIADVNRKFEVLAVIAEMFKGRWLVRIQAREKVVVVAVPRELADDVLDSGITSEVRKLRSLVQDALVGQG